MKKAFTLVELIAVIVIIGIISLIAIPAVSNIFENQKEEEYEKFLNNIYIVSETYVSVDDIVKEKLNSSGNVTITVGNLIEKQLITTNITNPKTGEVIKDTDTIKITKNSEGTLSFEYSES